MTFTDGGIATGSFVWDADTHAIGAYDISVSGGNTNTFPLVSYTNGDSSLQWFLLNGDTNKYLQIQI